MNRAFSFPPARLLRVASSACLLALAGTTPLLAQSPPTPTERPAAPAATTAAPVLSHDQNGRLVVHATRVTSPIKINGQLDEEVYLQVAPITDFVQQDPNPGSPISERTEIWVLFDDQNLYFACRCWDAHPERIVANEMRRDSVNLSRHDHVAVALDTFHDGRTGVYFYMTPIGGMRDMAVTDMRVQTDWNPVWDGGASRSKDGYILEMAFPFKSLRYGAGRQQTWGIQMRRFITSKNETAFLTPVDRQWGPPGISHFADAPTLIGLEVPPPSRNIEIKPYAISRLTTDLARSPAVRNDSEPNAGLDVKLGITKGLTADLTYNTDFAQVEVDEAQVNLTRFSLSFPEKREFFLEGQGLFQFGASGPGGRSGSSGEGGGADPDAPTIFYSRSIGLTAGGRAVPVVGGGRVTGKAGAWSLGALSITTGEDAVSGVPQTNFSVTRLRRDILSKSAIGGIFSRRSRSTVAPGANNLWGLDANLAFYQSVFVSGYVAQSRTEGRRGDDRSYRGQFNYTTDRYGLFVDRLVVGKQFNPEVGFLRRQNFRSNYAQARFSPRAVNNPVIRKYTYQGHIDYTTDNANHLESRELLALFRMDFQNADAISVQHAQMYEFLPAPFQIALGVVLPVGAYDFQNTIVSFNPGVTHRLSGSASLDIGSFYGGDKKTASLRGRIEITPQLGVEPNVSLNWVDVPQGRFQDTVVGGRTFFTITPRTFVAALIQYSSANASLSTNLRWRWEYRPGSELFVVYTEGRSTLPPRGTDLQNRGFVVKINRLFRF
ncbi:MAG: hypothetical protein EXQ59_01090 [Acidobacteria bacterium]|nr:hypothetical protein [Acidobacteriota bacterium]